MDSSQCVRDVGALPIVLYHPQAPIVLSPYLSSVTSLFILIIIAALLLLRPSAPKLAVRLDLIVSQPIRDLRFLQTRACAS